MTKTEWNMWWFGKKRVPSEPSTGFIARAEEAKRLKCLTCGHTLWNHYAVTSNCGLCECGIGKKFEPEIDDFFSIVVKVRGEEE